MPKGGLEVPCIVEFKGSREEINKVKWVLDKQRRNRERYLVKCSTDYISKESTDNAAEGSSSADLQQSSDSVKAMDGASSPNVPCNLLTNVLTGITRDTLTTVKKESHGTEASQSVAHLLPMSSCYIATEHSYAKGEPQSVWVRFGNSRLMTDEKVAINYGRQLNDRHINHVQVIIKHQFGMKGSADFVPTYKKTLNFRLFIPEIIT